jgi:hypothetical protein
MAVTKGGDSPPPFLLRRLRPTFGSLVRGFSRKRGDTDTVTINFICNIRTQPQVVHKAPALAKPASI